jgi:hypothetical protein
MVYKFLNEYLAKLSLLTASAAEDSNGEPATEEQQSVAEDQASSKITSRSSVSSIFDFNDKEKIEK